MIIVGELINASRKAVGAAIVATSLGITANFLDELSGGESKGLNEINKPDSDDIFPRSNFPFGRP